MTSVFLSNLFRISGLTVMGFGSVHERNGVGSPLTKAWICPCPQEMVKDLISSPDTMSGVSSMHMSSLT